MHYLIYERKYLPAGQMDFVHENKFALFSDKQDAVAELFRREGEYSKKLDMGFLKSGSIMNEEDGEYWLRIAVGIDDNDPSIRDGEIHLCMVKLQENISCLPDISDADKISQNATKASMADEAVKKAVFLKQEYSRNLEIIDFDGEKTVNRNEDDEVDYDSYENDWWLIEDLDIQTNGWPKLFLGIVEGESAEDVLKKAAENFNMPAEVLELMDV